MSPPRDRHNADDDLDDMAGGHRSCCEPPTFSTIMSLIFGKRVESLSSTKKVASMPSPIPTPVRTPSPWVPAAEQAFQVSEFNFLSTVGHGNFGRVHLVKLKAECVDRVQLAKTNEHEAGAVGDTFNPCAPFALKVMRKADILRHAQETHVKDESRLSASVEHPFIVKLFASFQDECNLYMLQEFVNGGELFSYIKKLGRFEERPTMFYAGEVTLSLEYLHAANIMYRDLKPENILLDRWGHLKLADFGFAKEVETKTWTLCGTAEYMAPESIQITGHGAGVDWWALGVLIFEMLTGATPFTGSSPMQIYSNVLHSEVQYGDRFNIKSKNFVARLLTRDKDRRLGVLSGGTSDVKDHKWFRGAGWKWDDLAAKEVCPPHVPAVSSADDTSALNTVYEKEKLPTAPSKHLQSVFEGFEAKCF